MTVFGIGGCMALLLVGFGLRDSIMDVVLLQYGEIQLYDGMLVLNEDASDAEVEALKKDLSFPFRCGREYGCLYEKARGKGRERYL